jgi:hypothetical protein
MKSSDATIALPGLSRSAAPDVSFFEYWPGWLFYAPVVAHWMLLGLRHRGFTLPTAANPRIPTGGLCGESKAAILDQVTGAGRDWIAPYTVFTTSADPALSLSRAEAGMKDAGLNYRLVVKPDIGCNGTGVRLIPDRGALLDAVAAFAPGTTLVLQQLAEEPGEAGLFYIRAPDEPRGRLTSVTLKSPPMVVGDGRSTLRALILADPRTGAQPQIYLPRLKPRWDEIPASGEPVQLVFVGNHCKGSTFRDGRDHITPELTSRIDSIARAIPDFHFGRFDLRYASLPELRQGRGFKIIEINGAGSEATHIWDPRTRLVDAYRAQFDHYAAAFRIGAENRKRGAKPTSPLDLFRHWKIQRTLMASYPQND